MAFTISFDNTKLSAPIVRSKTSKLAKRGIGGGFTYDLSKIPNNVLQVLVYKAIEDYLNAGFKNADLDNVTQEQLLGMQETRYNVLVSGNLDAPGVARKAPTQNPVLLEAKRMLKAAIKERSDKDMTGKDLQTAVNGYFKDYKTFTTSKTLSDEEKARIEPIAQVVKVFMQQAQARVDQQSKLTQGLASMAATMKATKSEAAPATPKASKKSKATQASA